MNNDLYGYSSTSRILFFLNVIVGNVLWESLDVSPCPGKCFAQANTPSLCIPLVNETALLVTLNLFSPYDLLPMIGFFGLVLISTTGAKFM